MIELTEEEKRLFKKHDKELKESASSHVEEGLMASYCSNNRSVQITYGYIKRILTRVAEKRGLNIKEDEVFDMDEILNKIIDIPKELEDFNPIYFKSEEQLQNYVDGKTKNMTSDQIDIFIIYFNGFNGIGGVTDCFREYMEGYIQSLFVKINQLEKESQEEQEEDDWEFGDSDDIEGPIIEYSTEEKEWSDWEEWEDAELEFDVQDFEGQEFSQSGVDDVKVSNDELCNYIKYINIFPRLNEYKNNGKRVGKKLIELAEQRKLEEFYSDKTFVEELKRIMAHDTKKHTYHFHGTQNLESAESIMKEGLGMMRKSLSTTSYAELTMDEVILYSRGLGGEIGREAIVIIDEPRGKNDESTGIVELLYSDKKINFIPSGLQGLNIKSKYIVNPQYIVGYIDKRNKAIKYNPRYYAYSKFFKPKGVPYSNDRIVDGVINAKLEELLEIMEQEDLQQ